MFNRKLILLVTLLNAFNLIAQVTYFATDSSISVGIRIESGNEKTNSQFCQVKENFKIIKYSPYEVSAYGLGDGREYFSKEIIENGKTIKVFLLLLVKDSTSLYFYQGDKEKQYFLETIDKKIIPLKKKGDEYNRNFREEFAEISKNCEPLESIIEKVNFNRHALIDFVERYNNCSSRPYPTFHYGLYAGYDLSNYQPYFQEFPDLNSIFSFTYGSGYIMGLLIENPIQQSNFSIYLGTDYTYHSYSYHKRNSQNDYNLLMEIPSLSFSNMLRFSVLREKIRPFFNIGFSERFNLNFKQLLYEANFYGSEVNIETPIQKSAQNEFLIGYSFGGGFDYQFTKKHVGFLEFRYDNLKETNVTNGSKVNNIQFITGIRF